MQAVIPPCRAALAWTWVNYKPRRNQLQFDLVTDSLKGRPRFGVIFDTISIKVCWEQWCRRNCDLRVIDAQKQAFSVVPKASPWHWKSCAYAHYVTLGSRCKMASSHRVTDLEKKSSSNLQGWSSDAIVSSWAFVYFLLVISSFSSLVRCMAFQSFLFCLL